MTSDPKYCGARRTRGDGTCRKPAGWGTSHAGDGKNPGAGACRLHGGATPSGTVSARRTLAAREAHALGLALDYADPGETLLEEVRRCAGGVQWLSEKVAGLDAAELVDAEHGVAVWVRLWQDERARLVDVCAAALRVGVEERMIRVAERQGAMIASVLEGIFRDLQLTPAQQAAVATVVPRHLRAVGDGVRR